MSNNELKSAVEISKGYTYIDKRGSDIGKPDKRAMGLYPSPSYNPKQYRPRYYNVSDTKVGVTSSDRKIMLKYGRSLFAQLTDIGGAIMDKASWAAGPGTYKPTHTGEDKVWGDIAEQFLINRFFPMCNVMGTNYDFNTGLYNDSIALEVDGDNLLILTTTRDGFPQIQIIPSHRIGNRNEGEMTEGSYVGYNCIDGVIVNSSGRPIAYNILGDTADEDYQVSIKNCQLLFETEWSDQYRGISRLARSQTDLIDSQDIHEYYKRGIKRMSAIAMTVHNIAGEADQKGSSFGIEEDKPVDGKTAQALEFVDTGDTYYFKAGANEKIEAIKDERPSQNVVDYLEAIKRRCFVALGWRYELIDPSKIGGASVRLIQDEVRKSIAQRQTTLEKRAKLIVNFALATAMKNGLIPYNNKDWYKWNFSKGGLLTVDNGNEAKIDFESLKIGATTFQAVCAKNGQDWYEVRNQQDIEVDDLLDRAVAKSKKYGITLVDVLNLLQQRTPNAAVTGGTPTDNKPVDNQVEDNNTTQDNNNNNQ